MSFCVSFLSLRNSLILAPLWVLIFVIGLSPTRKNLKVLLANSCKFYYYYISDTVINSKYSKTYES